MSNNVYNKVSGADLLRRPIPVIILLLFQAGLAYKIATSGITFGILGIALPIVISFVLTIMVKPQVGFYTLYLQSFVILGLSRYVPAQWGLTIDGVIILMYSSLFFRSFKADVAWNKAKMDITVVAFIWYGYLFLQIANPEAASRAAWFYAMRGLGLYMLLIIPLMLIIFDKEEHMMGFFIIWGIMSFLGTLKGAQQLILGPDPFEQAWLDRGGHVTHILFGKLRVFSFYSDAGQYGAAQAHAGVVFGILALGQRKFALKLFYIIVSLGGIYGMFISGTRGAIAVPVMGGALYFVLKKNIYVMVVGAIMGVTFMGFFKFTTIGNNIDQIRRMRTAFDPEDKSLHVRLENQRKLSRYLATRPLGGGVGSSGSWGRRFSPNTFLANIPPDSWYVMIWVELGIIGLYLHLGVLFYLLGKGCHYVLFKIRDDWIRTTTSAMACGMLGIMVASYGNGVLGQFPTGIMIYTSMVFMAVSPRMDEAAMARKEAEEEQEVIA